MEDFDKQFIEKLGSLNGTQASIQSLSAWLVQNKAKVKHVGKVWYKELKKMHRKLKLTMLYLMNDVVQNSRKQGPEFQRVFASVLLHAMKDCAKAADGKVMASMERLVRIWQDRRVFEPELLQRCRQMLEKFSPRPAAAHRTPVDKAAAEAAAKAAPRVTVAAAAVGDDDDDEALDEEEGSESGPEVASPALRDAGVGSDDDDDDDARGGYVGSGVPSSSRGGVGNGGVGVGALRAELAVAAQQELDRAELDLPDSDRVLAELQFLAAAPSGSAEMRRRISRFPKHIVEEASVDQCRGKRELQRLLREVTQADEVCADYNRQLAGEVERRRAFHADLRAYCRGQRAALASGRGQLDSQRRRLRELRGLRQELAGHLANLPDLATLPAVSGGGLAPLPSVGDLFS